MYPIYTVQYARICSLFPRENYATDDTGAFTSRHWATLQRNIRATCVLPPLPPLRMRESQPTLDLETNLKRAINREPQVQTRLGVQSITRVSVCVNFFLLLYWNSFFFFSRDKKPTSRPFSINETVTTGEGRWEVKGIGEYRPYAFGARRTDGPSLVSECKTSSRDGGRTISFIYLFFFSTFLLLFNFSFFYNTSVIILKAVGIMMQHATDCRRTSLSPPYGDDVFLLFTFFFHRPNRIRYNVVAAVRFRTGDPYGSTVVTHKNNTKSIRRAHHSKSVTHVESHLHTVLCRLVC